VCDAVHGYGGWLLDGVSTTVEVASTPFLLFFPSATRSTPLATCLHDSAIASFVDLISCLDNYTVPADFYLDKSFPDFQPSEIQRSSFASLVESMLWIDGNCTEINSSDAMNVLGDLYGAAEVRLLGTSAEEAWCILSEKHADPSARYFAKGWGTMVVPALKSSIHRDLHFSAPHPAYDLETPPQAAGLFHGTGGRSLFIAGRSRLASRELTWCDQPSSNKTPYYVTDPAHNTVCVITALHLDES
jgi:hypothetical protein